MLAALRNLPIPVARGVQFALDFAIVAALAVLASQLTRLVPTNPDGTVDALWSLLAILLMFAAATGVSWWVWVERPARRGGATPAMSWLGLRVRTLDGQEPGRAALALRWLLLLVDSLLFGVVGMVAMLGTPRGQRLGDLVAQTVVERD